jgi:hypothetical protein
MTLAIRTAVAILSMASFGTAYADSVGGTLPVTFFNQLPGVAEKPPMQNAPAAATAPDGAHAYVTQSRRGTWLHGSSHGGDGTQG